MGRAEGGGMRVRLLFIGLVVFQVFANVDEKDDWTASLATRVATLGKPAQL